MARFLVTAAIAVLFLLHQDFWYWRQARPLIFGFLPVGLFYHACHTAASAVVLGLLVKTMWPGHLEPPGGPEH